MVEEAPVKRLKKEVIAMATAKQKAAARKNIKKAHAANRARKR